MTDSTRNIEVGCRVVSTQNKSGIVQAVTGPILFCVDDRGNTFPLRTSEARLLYRIFIWFHTHQVVLIVDSTLERAQEQLRDKYPDQDFGPPLGRLETDCIGGGRFTF